MRELVDLGLAVFDLAVLDDDGLVTLDYLPKRLMESLSATKESIYSYVR